MEVPKCFGCGTIEKDYRSKRCFSCRTIYFRSEEWAKTPQEIERRRKISINNAKTNLGGKLLTEEVRKKIGLGNKGKKFPNGYKGDKVGYFGLHEWVRKHLGTPDTCEFCGKNGLTSKQINWANKSGDYLRDLTDWLRLCIPCHRMYDRNKLELK